MPALHYARFGRKRKADIPVLPLWIIILAPVSLALSLFVETSSWWVRAQAPPGAMGLYVSRSNIYLYGGRFFSLAFTSLIAFWIESGATSVGVALLIAGSLFCAAIFQLALLHHFRSVKAVMWLVIWALRLPAPEFHPPSSRHVTRRPLLLGTTVASLVFGFGTGMPLLAAVLVPEYRLSVSYIGQIINSVGTLVILLLVDQLLFRALDRGTLPDDVRDYGRGRVAGFLLAGLSFALLSLLL